MPTEKKALAERISAILCIYALLAAVCISRIWFMTLVSCRLWTLFTPSVTLLWSWRLYHLLPQTTNSERQSVFESDGRSVSQEFTGVIAFYYHFVKAVNDNLKFVTMVDSVHKCCVGRRLRSRVGLYLGTVFREIYLLSASDDWSPLY